MRLQLRILAVLALASIAGHALAGPPRAVTGTAQTEFSVYGDTDHVTVVSPGVSASITDGRSGWSVAGSYLVDVVSAASVDIVSSASGRWREARQAGTLSITKKTGNTQISANGSLSYEPDYLSVTGGLVATFDLLSKNLSPYFGVSYGHDDVGRTGLDRSYWKLLQRGNFLGGVAYTLDKRVIVSLQIDAGIEGGYLAKPYRYIPLFSPGVAETVPVGASVDLVNQLRLDARPVDRLPSERGRFALTGRMAVRLPPVTLRLDERLYTDTWGMLASTTDLRLFIDAGTRVLLSPHFRYHTQTAVNFWQRAYTATVSPDDGSLVLPAWRTGDRELSSLQTFTFGASARVQMGSDPRTPVYLALLVAGGYTQYPDALYIAERWSVLSSLTLNAEWH